MSDFLVIFKSECHVIDESENKFVVPIKAGMSPNLYIFDEYFPCYIENANKIIMPRESGVLQIRAIMTDKAARNIKPNVLFELRVVPNKIATGIVMLVENIQKLPPA